jgi:OHCU decarboxylase
VSVRPSQLDPVTFVARFGDVFEHSPWIAEGAVRAGLNASHDSAEGLHRVMVAVLHAASPEQHMALIKAHPDLAGRLALAKQLTADSSAEQASAGLDTLSTDELARFTALNDAYRIRFGFPFIMAVKGRSKTDILMAFERRLSHDANTEIATALLEIERIALLRLKERLPSA